MPRTLFSLTLLLLTVGLSACDDKKPIAQPPSQEVSPKQDAPERMVAQRGASKTDATATAPAAPVAPKSTPGRPGEATPAQSAKPTPAQSAAATPAPVEARAPRPAPSVPTQPPPPGLTLPRIATGPPLSLAHDSALVRRGKYGLLPIIGADGRKPWRVYARPFDRTDKRPRIAIVVSDLGHSAAETEAAIQGLPGAVTLAFSPYARRLDEMILLARAAGHEILLNVPMEPIDYPADDPGQQTLLTSLDPAENQRRLMWALGRVTGYVGVVDHWGSRFTASPNHMRPVLTALNGRGLMYLDSRASTRSATAEIATTIGLPWAINSHFVDSQVSREKIDARLRRLEAIARKNGSAIGMGSPYPVTLERIAAWIGGAGHRGFALAPISAVVVQDRPR